MSRKYKEFGNLNMPDIEKYQQKVWEEGKFFEKSIANRMNATPFVFYEGPPSANGLPGIHHVIGRTVKDLFCRYKTMQGFQVHRKAGWDTHGLPVELGVEKELGITKEDIGTKISVLEYNNKCREAVMRFKNTWDNLTKIMGYWVDLENPYITYETEYIESLWWALSELYKRGLLYKSVSIQPYSPAAGTGLSSHELNQPGTYKDVKDTSATVLFKLLPESSRSLVPDIDQPVYVMAWTTTPWTLPANLGLTVGTKIKYALVRTFNPYTFEHQYVILAESLIPAYFNSEGLKSEWHNVSFQGDKKEVLPYQIIKTFQGTSLSELRYEQLLPFENNTPEISGGDPFRIIIGDFVTTEDGTGIVHTAPAFGADDYKVGQLNNLGIINLVDREGKFIDGTGPYSGRFVKNYKDDSQYQDVNVDIAVDLKHKGLAFRIEKYEHNYPHCWRTDKPIIYYPLDAWFIKTTALKDKMVSLNKTIDWQPKSTGEGRFGNWLENMVDWNLSRSRFWGTPLPIWQTQDASESICIGSINQLKDEINKSIDSGNMPKDTDIEKLTGDLHKPFVDEIILTSKSGAPMYREPDLIDVWFDSGAMPFAQWHFPFENHEKFAANYPADFIAEGVDQTRGWFYTLHALAALLEDAHQEALKENGISKNISPYGIAYKHVISNGLVLDKDGNKMSKRVGNVIDPFTTIEKYSADATRWYLITNASPWESIRFDIDGIKEVQRKFFGTLYNTYQFYALYANVDEFNYSEPNIELSERALLDKWIMSLLNSLIKDVTKYLDEYEPTQAFRAIDTFLDEHLSNWYVRLSRRRFWKGEYEHDKICAYQTLYTCLITISKLIAPISPFFADWLFHNLNQVTNLEDVASVHLTDYPKPDIDVIDTSLEESMQLAQDISSLILSLRKKSGIKVRQPLSKVLIPIINDDDKLQIEKVKNIILSEVNIKTIEYISAEDNFIKKKIKPNFKTLGKKVGAKMKTLADMILSFNQTQINQLEQEGNIQVLLDEKPFVIDKSDVEIFASDLPGWSVANKGSLTVALDTILTQDLIAEGNARELVNRLQKIRKDNNLELTDKIDVYLKDASEFKETIERFNHYIKKETLAETIVFTDNNIECHWEDVGINERTIQIFIQKK